MTRKPDEIERKMERGDYPRHITLRTLYGGMAATDILAIPKFKHDNWALVGLLMVMKAEADKAPGLIGKAIAADKILDVPLDALYNELAKVDPAMPDDAARAADTLERIEAHTAYLYQDRKAAKEKHRERGAASQAEADNAERQRAAHDMETALYRVHDRMSHGETNLLQVCRSVCNRFTRTTTSKNEFGDYEGYAPLTRADGRPIKPETLAKNYRDRFGTARERKAKTAARSASAAKARAAKSQRPMRNT